MLGNLNLQLKARIAADSGLGVLRPRLYQGLQVASSQPVGPDVLGASDNLQNCDIEDAPLETVHAWLQAALNGDVNALAALFKLQGAISSRVRVSWQRYLYQRAVLIIS
jgi:hypothetical protein